MRPVTNVYRSTNPTTGFVKLNTDPLGASETTYADNTGTAGTTYYYYVKPVMAGGVEGPQTNTVSATPGWGLIGHYYNDGFWGTGNGNSVTRSPTPPPRWAAW
jgi:hypothetical protein